MGTQRFNPYFDPYYQRLNPNKQSIYQENQFDGSGAFSTAYGKRRKPKPFSVMLDIYPITETEQTKKSSKLKAQMPVMDDPGRPALIPFFARYPKVYNVHPQLPQAIPLQSQEHAHVPDDDEKHQMILHLNLYPKRKSKYIR